MEGHTGRYLWELGIILRDVVKGLNIILSIEFLGWIPYLECFVVFR
jgi:hypothetical protein